MSELAEPVASCGCISDLSNKLRPHNTGLVTTMFSTPERVCIVTDKVDTKKRGKPAILVATYCPFCGVRYAPSRSVFQPIAKAASPEGGPTGHLEDQFPKPLSTKGRLK